MTTAYARGRCIVNSDGNHSIGVFYEEYDSDERKLYVFVRMNNTQKNKVCMVNIALKWLFPHIIGL